MHVTRKTSGSGSLPPFSRPSASELHDGSSIIPPPALHCKVVMPVCICQNEIFHTIKTSLTFLSNVIMGFV